jgi:ubiquinone/menaquinone biosynthesis C-methylase UbiE
MNNNIPFLPGGIEQYNLLKKNVDLKDKIVLILGFGTDTVALQMTAYAKAVIIAVSSNEELIATRMKMQGKQKISVRLMSFDLTDFNDEAVDVIFAQGTFSNDRRNKILKEVFRILKPDGYLCSGEIVALREEIPPFVKDIWERAGMSCLFTNDIEKTYTEKNFKLITSKDLNFTLKSYYNDASVIIKNGMKNIYVDDLKIQKKFIAQLQHEVNAYLKLGGHKFIGFKTLLFSKVVNEEE